VDAQGIWHTYRAWEWDTDLVDLKVDTTNYKLWTVYKMDNLQIIMPTSGFYKDCIFYNVIQDI
jgi:hypothetical protein